MNHMEKELEALIKNALSKEETDNKQEEKKKTPEVTQEELDDLYKKDKEYWKN